MEQAGINAQAPAGAVVLAVAAPAAAAPMMALAGAAPTRRSTVAKVLFVLGCAAAALALFVMAMNPDHSILFLGPCALTDAEAADLRTAAQELLLTAAAQVLASTVAAVQPARPFAILACASSAFTASRVASSLQMLVACSDTVHKVALVTCYVFFLVALFAAFLMCVFVSSVPDD